MAQMQAIFTGIFILVTIGLNIAALSSSTWYSCRYSDVVPYLEVTQDYDQTWGLLSATLCAEGDYTEKTCDTTSYSDIDTDDLNSSDKQKLDCTRAGGALVILFLTWNILLSVVLLYVTASVLYPSLQTLFGAKFEVLMGRIQPKIRWLPSVLLVCQVIAMAWWAGLFGYYKDYEDDGIEIGTGIILMLCSTGFALAMTVVAIIIEFEFIPPEYENITSRY